MLHRYDLMCECWATNPESRPTFSTILLELKKFSQVSYRNKLYRYNLSKDACSVQREITLFNFWFQCPQILTAELPKFFMVPFQSFSPTTQVHSVSEDESELTVDSDTTEPLLNSRCHGSLKSSKKSVSPKDSVKFSSLRVNLQPDSSCDKKAALRDPFPSLCDMTSLCENEYETHTSDSRLSAPSALDSQCSSC